MAIIFNLNNTGTGTLSPPILNGITEINAPAFPESLTLFSTNELNLNCNDVIMCNAIAIKLENSIGSQIIIDNNNIITISSENFLCNNTNTEINATNSLSLNSNKTININNAIQIGGASTADILAIPSPIKGTFIYNNTLDGFFFYQNSPITGLVLGWYNSTGTIKL